MNRRQSCSIVRCVVSLTFFFFPRPPPPQTLSLLLFCVVFLWDLKCHECRCRWLADTRVIGFHGPAAIGWALQVHYRADSPLGCLLGEFLRHSLPAERLIGKKYPSGPNAVNKPRWRFTWALGLQAQWCGWVTDLGHDGPAETAWLRHRSLPRGLCCACVMDRLVVDDLLALAGRSSGKDMSSLETLNPCHGSKPSFRLACKPEGV